MQSFNLTLVILALAAGAAFSRNATERKEQIRQKRLLSMFQIVTFPNNGCGASGGKNGTCYTSTECADKDGTSSGSCAEGYGVCCVFSKTCGGVSSENCTYFENTGSEVGACTVDVCKCSSDICQLRLDFNLFSINGPVTSSATTGAYNTNAYAAQTTCATDTFTVTSPGSAAPPTLCGVLTGEHIYVDASDVCNQLAFVLGTTSTTTRQWSIKVTQYSCTYNNLAPSGCTQYFFGPDATSGTVQSFNFDQGIHLANQNQRICFRRESGQCRMCYSIDAKTDFMVSMNGATATKSKCCGYGTSGAATSGYDCLVIPDAMKSTITTVAGKFSEFCGSSAQFTSIIGAAFGTGTVCSRKIPFEIAFLSDDFEFVDAEAMLPDAGFRLSYFQDSTGC